MLFLALRFVSRYGACVCVFFASLFFGRFGNIELLKILKRAGGNPDITSALGLTPLSYACAFKLSIGKSGGGALEDKQVRPVSGVSVSTRVYLGLGVRACHDAGTPFFVKLVST